MKDCHYCPICGEKYKVSCKCLIGHKVCENGHGWHYCYSHNCVCLDGDSSEHKNNCKACEYERDYKAKITNDMRKDLEEKIKKENDPKKLKQLLDSLE